MCVFGRPIKDFIPILPGRYQPHPTWKDTLDTREHALRNRHMKACERLSEHTRNLPPLTVGDRVRLQNQVGPHPTKWDKTGVVIEVRQFHQYAVRIDGSGRITLRNRKFLRKYQPAQAPLPRRSVIEDLRFLPRQLEEDVSIHEQENHRVHPRTPSHPLPKDEPSEPTESPEPSVPDVATQANQSNARRSPPKPPLALRCLMDFNAPGERW